MTEIEDRDSLPEIALLHFGFDYILTVFCCCFSVNCPLQPEPLSKIQKNKFYRRSLLYYYYCYYYYYCINLAFCTGRSYTDFYPQCDP